MEIVMNMIRSYPNKLSNCWTPTVGLGEKRPLKEDVKNSNVGFWDYPQVDKHNITWKEKNPSPTGGVKWGKALELIVGVRIGWKVMVLWCSCKWLSNY